jgi:uncharacterized RDD family membrane protein YckC
LCPAPDNPAAASSDAPPVATGVPALAPNGLRAAAFLVDAVLVAALFRMSPGTSPWALLPALFVAYHTVQLWLVQRTVGKAIFSLRVRRVEREPTFLWALGRSSLGYLSVDVVLIGALTVLVDRRHRALHDLVFGSEVVHEPGLARGRLKRLVEFAEQSGAVLEQKKKGSRLKPVFILLALWGSLEKLAGLVGKAVTAAENVLGRIGAPSPAASAAQATVLPVKAAAVVAIATTAVGATTVVAVPPLRNSVDGLAVSRSGEHQARVQVRLSEIDEGNCIESLPPSQIVPLESVMRIDCDLPHQAEAYAVLEYDDGPFPGRSVLGERAGQECRDRFEPLSDRASALDWNYLVPYDDATWRGGYRQITCLAFRKDGEPLEGSSKG